MNTMPQTPAAKPPSDQDNYLPGDPIPVPLAVEANTESTWAMFDDVPRLEKDQKDFLDTVPISVLEEESIVIGTKKPS